MPAPHPPHKEDKGIPTVEHRIEMLKLAANSNEFFDVSDLEADITGTGKSFTVNTLRTLREMHNDECDFFLIIGMDNLIEFHTWKEPDKILKLTKIIVMKRPGFDNRSIKNGFEDKVTFIDTPLLDISSTKIRKLIKEGGSAKYLIPDNVLHYINEKGLYK
jgi:nicotinate-nucleotide adenylyltransferase